MFNHHLFIKCLIEDKLSDNQPRDQYANETLFQHEKREYITTPLDLLGKNKKKQHYNFVNSKRSNIKIISMIRENNIKVLL